MTQKMTDHNNCTIHDGFHLLQIDCIIQSIFHNYTKHAFNESIYTIKIIKKTFFFFALMPTAGCVFVFCKLAKELPLLPFCILNFA